MGVIPKYVCVFHSFAHSICCTAALLSRRCHAARLGVPAFVCVCQCHCQAAPAAMSASLMRQLIELNKNPTDGFAVRGIVNGNIFKWHVIVFGPPNTPYEGGTFLAQLNFPTDYPAHPPQMRFLTKILHPNIHNRGYVCISILHPPGNGPFAIEHPTAERWQPIHTVESIVISVQSLLAEPNFTSPANLGASLLYRNTPERYNEELRRCVKVSNVELEDDYRCHTNEENLTASI